MIGEILKEPMNGFILETPKERMRRIRAQVLQTLQSEADGYKLETRKQRKLRIETIQAHLRRIVPEGESKIAKTHCLRRETRVIEEMLKEPVNGFILETHKERKRRIRRAQAKEERKESVTPGDSSIEPKSSATTVQTIITSDSDSGHRDSPQGAFRQ